MYREAYNSGEIFNDNVIANVPPNLTVKGY